MPTDVPISIACPFCYEPGQVPSHYFGQRVRCRRCRESFPVTSQVRGEDYVAREEAVAVQGRTISAT